MNIGTKRHRCISWVAIIGTALLTTSAIGQAVDTDSIHGKQSLQETVEWLSGSDSSLTFHVRGTFVGGDGIPMDGVSAHVELTAANSNPKAIDVTIDGSNFRFDVPGGDWWSVSIYARNDSAGMQAFRSISVSEIRQVASERFELKLEPASRTIVIKVLDDDKPVADAGVKITFESNHELVGQTNDDGLAEFHCLPSQKLLQITAWQGDQKLGGYSFNRTPLRDPVLNEHAVHLVPPRSQKIRLVDQENKPVAGAPFTLNVSTAGPDYNFLGTSQFCTMTSDENGEAIATWFPDWVDVNYYATLLTDEWAIKSLRNPIVDGDILFRLQRTRKNDRQRVTGRLRFADDMPQKFVGGFQVQVRSSQGEVENRADGLRTFTNPDGTFSVDVLPDATYCYFVDDAEWVSKAAGAVFYDSSTGKAAEPFIEIRQGYEVAILATQGPDKQPMANQAVSLRSAYRYSWVEDGRTRNTNGGLSRYVQTDANGKLSVWMIDGPLVASVYTPDWQFEETVEVLRNKVTELNIHRPVGSAAAVVGQLIPAKSQATDLAGTTITIASLDGQTRDQQSVVADANGRFEFESTASKVGIYAYSSSGQSSAVKIVDLPIASIELAMAPTRNYHGQLLGDDDVPLAGHLVRAKVQMSLPRESSNESTRQLDGNTLSAVTDANGNYTIEGVPVGIRFLLSAKPTNGPAEDRQIGERYMDVDEKRPRDVYRFGQSPTTKPRVFSKSLSNNLRDCDLYGIHSLVVILSDEETSAFSQEVVLDFDNCPAVISYLPFLVLTADIADQPEKQKSFADHDWSVPAPGFLTLCVLDGIGKEIDRMEVDSTKADAKAQINDFLLKNEPPKHDARVKLAEALEEARRTGRKVWAQHSQTRCGPCFLLSRWIDDHRAVLEKDFVFLKVDDVRDEGGIEVAKKITGDRHLGIPFVAILDTSGTILIDGESPLGNCGFPDSFEGAHHLRKMILQNGTRITDSELDELVESLLDFDGN